MASPPGVKLLLRHPAHTLALGFGSGLSPWAPGTVGTLFGWLLFAVVQPHAGVGTLLLLGVAGFAIGVPVCTRAGRALGVVDHGAIVWDEIVAIWLVLAVCPATPGWQAAAVAAFRFFDIVKLPPASWIDRDVKNGFGVMLDDLVAAGYALLTLAFLEQTWTMMPH